ncbi:armadillo repeat-containing protein 2-like isoform X2 [Lineus longissimus]|uniref:armadillo repeat-containing protein 2-like isoform X2 n=1 Tax=Lineus longissimus TaxID=88925 RepID=UPI00315D9787
MMEPTPPRKPKTDRPFYQAPDNLATSSKIISEARSSLRSLRTNRPFTPRDENRSLFGTTSTRNPETRPPSAFSLGSRHFDGSDSRPVSGTRLTPIDHLNNATGSGSGTSLSAIDEKPKAVADIDVVLAPKPPVDPNRPISRKTPRARGMQPGVSSENIGDKSDVSVNNNSVERRVHSGPKERTSSSYIEERGEGDGSDEPRASSASEGRKTSSDRKHRDSGKESGYGSDRVGSGGSSRGSSAGKSGTTSSAAAKGGEETPEEALYYTQHVGLIIEEMITQKGNTERLIHLGNMLYKALSEGNLLGRNCKRRSAILKSIFKLLDMEEPRLLLVLARNILALKVSGNNLMNVCKLVFKVSKDEKNDTLFVEDGVVLGLLVQTLKGMDIVASTDALVYLIGAIKLISGSNVTLKPIAKEGCIGALAKMLTQINQLISEAGKPMEQLGHILVQLTAALRNLADTSSSREKFIHYKVVDEVCRVLELCPGDHDSVLNVSRILSKLTLHMDCCNIVSQKTSSFKSFLNILTKYQKKEDVVVRISFILGNLTAKSDDSRLALYQQPKSIETIISVFKYYMEANLKSSEARRRDPSISNQPKKETKNVEDVLMKLVRVIANLSINENVGPTLAGDRQCHKLLLHILDSKDVTTSEELVLNTIATINNLTYYMYTDKGSEDYVDLQVNIAESLLKLVLTNHMEGLIEAVRVYGNLSRQKPVRDFLVENKVDKILVTLLDSGNRDIVYAACGVLINMMADTEKRATLKTEGGITKLVDVLSDFGRNDWQLASMVCQILMNYSAKITSSNDCFGEQETQTLSELLIEYLDDEAALDNSVMSSLDAEMREFMSDKWEADFCPVASQLLDRIERHQSEFEPLEPSPS